MKVLNVGILHCCNAFTRLTKCMYISTFLLGHRLHSGARIEFVSSCSTLIAEIDGLFMRSMLDDEASTRTMNLFGLYV